MKSKHSDQFAYFVVGVTIHICTFGEISVDINSRWRPNFTTLTENTKNVKAKCLFSLECISNLYPLALFHCPSPVLIAAVSKLAQQLQNIEQDICAATQPHLDVVHARSAEKPYFISWSTSRGTGETSAGNVTGYRVRSSSPHDQP